MLHSTGTFIRDERELFVAGARRVDPSFDPGSATSVRQTHTFEPIKLMSGLEARDTSKLNSMVKSVLEDRGLRVEGMFSRQLESEVGLKQAFFCRYLEFLSRFR